MLSLVTSRLARCPVLSAAVIDDPALAVPLARALLAGGVDLMEVTLRNPHALECIRLIARDVPDMLIGAGTLLTPAQVEAARDVGARFGLSPGFNPSVTRAAVGAQFPFIPGVATPGEMEQSLELGCPVVKFFPAAAAGGPAYLRALAAPYAHTDLRIIPLGGITEENLEDYLQLPLVLAVGGSWLTDRSLAREHRWMDITHLAQRALARARQGRQRAVSAEI